MGSVITNLSGTQSPTPGFLWRVEDREQLAFAKGYAVKKKDVVRDLLSSAWQAETQNQDNVRTTCEHIYEALADNHSIQIKYIYVSGGMPTNQLGRYEAIFFVPTDDFVSERMLEGYAAAETLAEKLSRDKEIGLEVSFASLREDVKHFSLLADGYYMWLDQSEEDEADGEK